MDKNLLDKILYLSAILLLSGILLFLSKNTFGVYITGSGAILFLALRLYNVYTTRSKRKAKNRLPMLRLFSATSLVIMTYYMHEGSNTWPVLAFASAMLELYVSYREK